MIGSETRCDGIASLRDAMAVLGNGMRWQRLVAECDGKALDCRAMAMMGGASACGAWQWQRIGVQRAAMTAGEVRSA